MDDFDLIDISEEEKTMVLSIDETVEMLDFENDIKVSSEIDEMLDFIEITPREKQNEELDKLLDNITDSEAVLKIEEPDSKIDEYVPSIKDFNIKSARTRKIVKKVMLYVIIVMLLGFEFFITKAGDTLNDIRVYASDIEPIKIVQNDKYGYIDYTGRKIVNPKYSYGEDFINGYAIVKDSSNLPFILDKGGNEVAPVGTYFSLYRAGEDIVASKVTKKGLKYGILDSNLNVKTKFKFDSINYIDGAYTYVLDNEVGIINLDGKKVYSYKLTDSDDKIIRVSASKVNDNNIRYAVVTINSSSSIVNLSDGTVVFNPTLEVIVTEDNNVFYIEKENGSKNYLYVYNNEVILERTDASSISVPSINSGIVSVLKNNFKYEFISVKTKEQIKKDLNKDYTYYADNYFIYRSYNYKTNKEELNFVSDGEIKNTINYDFILDSTFINGVATIKYQDGTYSYLGEDGKIITDLKFVIASTFDGYGEVVSKTTDGYGVMNKSGEIIIPFENTKIKMVNSEVKKNTFNDENVFYAVKKENRFLLYNSKGKKVSKTYYEDIVFDEKYPLFKASTDAYDLLITSENLNEVKLTSFNSDYVAYENYIIVKNEYYNYNGKNIYTDNQKK